MADGFIVRKGGVAVERTTAPSINFVSKTDSEIVVTFTNNDAAEAEIYYGITSTLTDTVTLAAAATSSNITFSGLDAETAFTVSAYALVTDPTSKKIKSEIVTTNITSEIPAPTITLVSKTDSSITFTLTNNSVQERDVTFGLTTPPTTTTITLASQATSGNQTFSNLDDDTTFIIFAQAADGVIGQLSVTTDVRPVFTAATGGTTLEYDSGGKRFKSHTFTSNGNFVVGTVGDNIDDRNKVDYLIIAGGGSGGGVGGGGGAGGFRSTIAPTPSDVTPNAKVTVTATTFGVTIGAGGAAISSRSTDGNKGSNSQVAFASTIIAEGGGASTGDVGNRDGFNGGSGGGGGVFATTTTIGGLGTSGQGRNGGGNGGFITTPFPAGGGGGAGAVGQTAPNSTTSGKGGNGLSNTLRNGNSETRAGGGGAGAFDNNGTPASGGTGGGGNGGRPNINPTAGTVNTGGGGGGLDLAATSASVGGGSGIVIIRYEIAPSV